MVSFNSRVGLRHSLEADCRPLSDTYPSSKFSILQFADISPHKTTPFDLEVVSTTLFGSNEESDSTGFGAAPW
jgi:hypothetical protein